MRSEDVLLVLFFSRNDGRVEVKMMGIRRLFTIILLLTLFIFNNSEYAEARKLGISNLFYSHSSNRITFSFKFESSPLFKFRGSRSPVYLRFDRRGIAVVNPVTLEASFHLPRCGVTWSAPRPTDDVNSFYVEESSYTYPVTPGKNYSDIKESKSISRINMESGVSRKYLKLGVSDHVWNIRIKGKEIFYIKKAGGVTSINKIHVDNKNKNEQILANDFFTVKKFELDNYGNIILSSNISRYREGKIDYTNLDNSVIPVSMLNLYKLSVKENVMNFHKVYKYLGIDKVFPKNKYSGQFQMRFFEKSPNGRNLYFTWGDLKKTYSHYASQDIYVQKDGGRVEVFKGLDASIVNFAIVSDKRLGFYTSYVQRLRDFRLFMYDEHKRNIDINYLVDDFIGNSADRKCFYS